MTFSNSGVADRIKEQTAEHLKLRAEQKLRATELVLEDERRQRRIENAEVDILFHEILGKVDGLIEFIVHRCGELPPEIIELIAERQEQRIEATLPIGGIDLADGDAVTGLLPLTALPVGQDGQVLKRTSGTVGWSDPDPSEGLSSEGFKPKSLATIRQEVQRLVSCMKDK